MESHPLRSVKRPRLSLWLCNELVWEFCGAIPIVNTWKRILLTSINIHTYLGARFRKMGLIYRDLITFIKAKLKANKNLRILIDEVAQNKESEPIVGVNQAQSNNEFMLETNHFTIRIENRFSNEKSKVRKVMCFIYDSDGNYENAHLQYFLRLIAPLVRPIHLDLYRSRKPIELLMPSLNALSGCIDSIGLSPEQFNSAKFDEALGKYNKLQIYCSRSSSVPVNVPKLLHWLTNGQSKKYLYIRNLEMNESLIQLMDEIKKDFALSTSKRRFVVRLFLPTSLDEFTLCNELTGEILDLRRKHIEDWKLYVNALRRSPKNNEMDNIKGIFREFDPYKMTVILP